MTDSQTQAPRALPEATSRPCNECPWRTNALRGWLGPHDAEEWAALIHSDEAIACHKTIPEDSEDPWEDPAIRQCAGAAIMRANLCKLPRDPEVAVGEVDRDAVFGHTMVFIDYHRGARA